MSSSRQSPKLLDRVRRTCRRQQFSLHTERAYVRWIIRYVRFHDTTHPRHLDEADIRTFLNHLATDRNVAAATQNQALMQLQTIFFGWQSAVVPISGVKVWTDDVRPESTCKTDQLKLH